MFNNAAFEARSHLIERADVAPGDLRRYSGNAMSNAIETGKRYRVYFESVLKKIHNSKEVSTECTVSLLKLTKS